jgi:hypothetical protein
VMIEKITRIRGSPTAIDQTSQRSENSDERRSAIEEHAPDAGRTCDACTTLGDHAWRGDARHGDKLW